ncbi:MAG: NUDIX domain-containing protein [Treponema sp.]|nr:NUDIX domain-containing protein [Treponema sp.]
MVENHFTATGIVFGPENKILMIRHNKLGVWLPPGGHVEPDELPTDAALREILEETGIAAEIIDTGRKLDLRDNHCRELEMPFTILLEDIEGNGLHNHIDLVFLCRALNFELKPRKEEVGGIGWFSPAEIRELATFENVLKTAALASRFIEERDWPPAARTLSPLSDIVRSGL